MADGSLTRHGFPRGFRFTPTSLELISLLSDQIHAAHGGELPPPPHDMIFHNLQILGYHPDELYDMYRQDAEDKYIYFFSRREYQYQQRSPEQKEQRPVRVARGGTWKPSGRAKMLKCGGFIAGRKVTLVFYDRGVDKTNWGMHEFLVPVDTKITSLPLSPHKKYPRFHDLALYRLYILRSSDMESSDNGSGSSSHMNDDMMTANAAHGRHLPASTAVVSPCPPVQPLGIFASPSYMPPLQQLLLHPSVELDHAHYYHQQMLPAGDSCYLARPAMPPAAADPAAHQDPETAVHQDPETAAHGAGQEAAHYSVDKRSPPADQHATATTEEEESAPPPPEDIMPPAAQEVDYDGPGMPDWNLDLAQLNDPRFEFTMAEILGIPGFDDGASLGY